MRRYSLFTEVLVPVDHEYCGQSATKHPNQVVSKARVIESPVEAIDEGSGVGGVVAACAVVAGTTSAARASRTRTRRRRTGTPPGRADRRRTSPGAHARAAASTAEAPSGASPSSNPGGRR